eukprot:4956051-Pleurochrysis_carterae.AAC.1
MSIARYRPYRPGGLSLYEYWSRFQVGIYDGCYFMGEAIAVSQLAGRGIPRFIPIPISYIFQFDTLLYWSGLCPSPDRRCSAQLS